MENEKNYTKWEIEKILTDIDEKEIEIELIKSYLIKGVVCFGDETNMASLEAYIAQRKKRLFECFLKLQELNKK